MESPSVSGIIQIIAFGVPAMLIFLGFCAYVGGFTFGLVSGNFEMKSTGVLMMITGVAIYIVEFIAMVASHFSGDR